MGGKYIEQNDVKMGGPNWYMRHGILLGLPSFTASFTAMQALPLSRRSCHCHTGHTCERQSFEGYNPLQSPSPAVNMSRTGGVDMADMAYQADMAHQAV